MLKLANKINEVTTRAAVRFALLKNKLLDNKGDTAVGEGAKIVCIIIVLVAIIALATIYLRSGGQFESDVKSTIQKMFNA